MNLQSNDIIIHTAVKIHKPKNMHKFYHIEKTNEFAFTNNDIFIDYLINKSSSFLTIDNIGNCFYITNFKVSSLSELKLSRQIFKPSYLGNDVKFPLIERLNEEELVPILEGYDKAYAHVSVFTEDLNSFSSVNISRFANVDGPDDPTVVDKIHYISSYYKNYETRFVSGVETNSFLTITENKDYFYKIHIPNVSTLYLKYFIYFSEHDRIPSKQMLPKLLGNLWRSMQGNTSDFNENLFKTLCLNSNKST